MADTGKSVGSGLGRGFSLLEVAIASALLAIVLLAVFSSIISASSARRLADEGRRLEDWSARHLEVLLMQRTVPLLRNPPSTTFPDRDTLGGTVTDLYAPDPSGISGLYQVTTSISYNNYLGRRMVYAISSHGYFPR